MAKCKVKSVTAPNGKPSILYEDLLRVTQDQERAMDLYLELADTSFPAHERDKNGEPTIDAVADAGLLNYYEQSRYDQGPSGFNQTTTSSMEDDLMNGVVSQIDYAIDELNRILNSSRDEAERKEIEDQIDRLLDDRRKIQESQTVQSIRNAANRQIGWAKDISNKDDASIESIMEAIKLMDMWDYDNTSSFLSSAQIQDNSRENQLFKDASGRAAQIQESLIDTGMERILELVEKYDDNDITDISKSDLKSFEDINTVKNLFFNISHVHNDLIGHFHKTLVSAKRRPDNELESLSKSFQELEDRGVDPKTLLREDEDGNKTAELISPYNKEYYNERSKALSDYYNAVDKSRELNPEDADDLITNAKKKLYSRLNDIEEIVDIRILSDDFQTKMSAEEYKDKLINKYGKDRAEFAIEKALTKYQQYKRREKDFRRYLTAQIKSGRVDTKEGESNKEWVQRKINSFKAKNSPAWYTRDRRDPSALQYEQSTGWEYTYSLPKDADQISDKFESLTKDEREMWDLITNKIQEGLSNLPPNVRRGMDVTFLPKVKKSTMEMMKNEGMWETAKFSVRNFMDDITSAEDQTLKEEEEEKIPNPFKGPGGSPPIRFIQHPDEGENVLSKDPIKATQMFYAMAMNYKQMTDVSAEAEMIHRIVSEANTVSKDGNEISQGAPRNLKDSIEEEMEFLISDTRKRNEQWKSESVDFVPEDNPLRANKIRREKLELENDRDQLKDDFREGNEVKAENYNHLSEDDLEDIDQSGMVEKEYNELLDQLDQQYKDLGGRSLIWSSLLDNTLLSFAQLKGMGLNLGASVRNLGYGVVANLIHAAGEQEFTSSDVLNAFNAMIGDLATRSGKVQSLVNRYGILFQKAEVRQGEDRNQTSVNDAYFLQNTTEYLAQGLTMVSTMMSETVVDKEGNERSLWEAFDQDGVWKTEEFGDNKDWKPSPNRDRGRKFQNFSNKVIQLNNRLHGDYAKDSNQKVKKHVLGRLAMMFRTWIPELFAYRFGGRRKDHHLGRSVVGSYRGTFNSLKKTPTGTAIKLLKSITPFTNATVEESPLDETQVAAIKRTGKEMQIWLALGAIVTALQPPEDEEVSAQRKILINNLLMLQKDTEIYWNPLSANELITDPIPAITSLSDFNTAMENTYMHLFNENYRGKGPAESWSGAFPITKQYNTIKWQSDQILQE